ncbi:WD40-repeat-containing domain protein [Tuber brumale]|nr:WD40-repeat-containing domain protein [Tuber brumale]
MERRKLYRELNGARGIGSNASFYGARSWIERLDLVAELSGHEGCVNTLCWSRSGELLASGSDDQQVNIHTVYPDFALNTRIDTGHTQNIFSVKFMPHSSDRIILSAAGDSQVRIFDVEYASTSLNSAANRSNRPLPPASVPAIGQHFFFGRRIVAGSDIVPLKGYSYVEDRHKVYRSHTSRVKRIVTEANPHTFLTCSEDGTVRQWDLRQPSEFYAMPAGRGRRGRGRGYYGMTVIDDEDEDGSSGGGAPPLISYRKWGIELNAISCSTSQPFYIALGGRNLHCFLHDRRMSGRDLAAERGAGRSLSPSSSSSSSTTTTATTTTAMDTATRCVRKFVPRPGGNGGWADPHITSCKISDAHPDNVLVSWSGDGIYMFSINQSPEEPGSGSDKKGKEAWGPDERRDRDASDPGPSSSSTRGRRRSADEPMSKRLRESGRGSSSPSSSPSPSSRRGAESGAETEGEDRDRDRTLSTPFPEGQFLTIAGLLTALKQKLTTLQSSPSSPEAEGELASDILATATHTYRRIRRKLLSQERRDLEFLAHATLAESNSEFRRRRGERNGRARERRKTRDWVRAVGHYAHVVLLSGEVNDEGFEELEYTRDVGYRVFRLACGVAVGGREGGVEVIRGEQGVGFGFGDGDGDGDGDGGGGGDEEGMLREYFTDLLINASPQPILDASGNTLYNSESDLIASLRTLMHSPSPPLRASHLRVTLIPALLLALCPPISTPSPSPTPSISPTPSSPLHQSHHQSNPYSSITPSHHSALYLGHANTLTIKDVTFLGQRDEYVVSGSDDGNFFIWDARSAQIVNVLAGDEEVVNVVVGHPYVPVLAVAGIGCRVGIFGVEGGSTGGRGRMEDVYGIVARNEEAGGSGGRGDGGEVRAVCVPS